MWPFKKKPKRLTPEELLALEIELGFGDPPGQGYPCEERGFHNWVWYETARNERWQQCKDCEATTRIGKE